MRIFIANICAGKEQCRFDEKINKKPKKNRNKFVFIFFS